MIRKTVRKPEQDTKIYSDGYLLTKRNPRLSIYGDSKNSFILAEEFVKWLGLNMSYQDLLSVVDDSERMVKLVKTDDTKATRRWCINESGACRVIDNFYTLDDKKHDRLESRIKEGFEQFRNYSTQKAEKEKLCDNDTGEYKYTVDEIMQNPDILINALSRLKEEQEKNKKLTEEISVLEPKADYYDKVLNTSNGVSVSVIAKEYGKSALWLNNLLHKFKIQYRQGETWCLYGNYDDKGYTCTKTHQYTDEYGVTKAIMHTYWTQAGRKFIYDTLKKHGIEPVDTSK